MSVASYLWGVAVLAGALAAAAWAATVWTAWLLPGWRGPLRLLGGLSLTLCWVYAVSYVLGALGWFRPWPLLVLVAGGALALGRLAPRRAPAAGPAAPGTLSAAARTMTGPAAGAQPAGASGAGEDGGDAAPAERSRGWDALTAVALAAAGLVALTWLPATAHAYRFGILEPDSTWYHGHAVGRFLQTGWLTRIDPVGTDTLTPFHPHNREVLDALLVMPWHRDLLLPLLSLAGLGLLLLAGWCVGDRWRRGPAGLLAMALIASPATVLISQPGSLKNDLLAASFMVAGLALLLHSDRRAVPAVALAGAMLGLAVGTRTNLLLPVGIVAVVGSGWLLAGGAGPAEDRPGRPRRSRRWVPAAAWVGSIALFGSYWYLRNWIRVGNPLPWSDISLGPLHLSQAGSEEEHFFEQTILHWRGHPDLVSSAIHPGLRLAFDNLWWVWALLGAACAALALARRTLWTATLAVAGGLGLAFHVATPLSLVVEPASSMAAGNVAVNMRYALPAFGLVLLAGVAALPGRRTVLAFSAVAAGLIVAGLPVTGLSQRVGLGFPSHLMAGTSHDAEAADAPLAVALGVGLAAVAVVVLVAGRRLRGRPWPQVVAVTAVPLLALSALALPAADSYLDRRYATASGVHGGELWPATRHLEDARIGIATAAVPYPHLGGDLSNRVEYVGLDRGDHLLRDARTCEEWVGQVVDRDLTHVALTPSPVAGLPVRTAREWTLAIPGTRVVHEEGEAALIEVPPDPTPAPC